MRQKTTITKLLQSVTKVYYNVCQVLQSASGITKCDSYYKVRRNNGLSIYSPCTAHRKDFSQH